MMNASLREPGELRNKKMKYGGTSDNRQHAGLYLDPACCKRMAIAQTRRIQRGAAWLSGQKAMNRLTLAVWSERSWPSRTTYWFRYPGTTSTPLAKGMETPMKLRQIESPPR